jgi:hypothetical protein
MIDTPSGKPSGFLPGLSVHPTFFYKKIKQSAPLPDSLRQKINLKITSSVPLEGTELIIHHPSLDLSIPLEPILAGNETYQSVYIPEISHPTAVTFLLKHQGEVLAQQVIHWQPARHWEVHLVHSSHHDLGYTDLPSNIWREQALAIDDAIRFCKETQDYPDEARFRYLIEQAWSAQYFIEHRPPEQVAEFARLCQEGRIEVTALYGNQTSELCGSEELIRLLYPAFHLKRHYGIPIQTAELNDIPGFTWGLASVLAGSGIRYFAPGIPDYFSWGFKARYIWNEQAVLPRDLKGAFWWEGPDGSRVLLWYEGGGIVTTMPWAYEQGETDLATSLASLETRAYPFNTVRYKIISSYRDNSPADKRFSDFVKRWNNTWAYPHLTLSTNSSFFHAFETEMVQKPEHPIKTIRGDLPNTDYSIGASSTALETGINRLAHDMLLSAEKFAAINSTFAFSSSIVGKKYPYPAESLTEASNAMLLYDEHTWGMSHPLGPAQNACWNQKREFATRAAALAQDILEKSTNVIADQIALKNEGYHLVLFNPLDQERDDLAVVQALPASPCSKPVYWKLPAEGRSDPPVFIHGTAIDRDLFSLPPNLLAQPFEIIDTDTDESLPYQLVFIDDPLAPRPQAAERFGLGNTSPLSLDVLNYNKAQVTDVVFKATSVPSLGYKTYQIRPTSQPNLPASTPQHELVLTDTSIENRFYRVKLDAATGSVQSIWDKDLKIELVDSQAPHAMNQLVIRHSATGKMVHPTASHISRGAEGAVFASLMVKLAAPGCPQVTQEIILYNSIKRIDFNNRILRDATPLLETYFSFPFASHKPHFTFETADAAVRPILDQFPGSNTAAYTVQHWVSVQDETHEVVWSSLEAPVAALGELATMPVSQAHHGATPADFGYEFLNSADQFKKGHIYSYASINNFRTNFQPVQVADMLFRYSISSQSVNAAGNLRHALGWGMSTPFASAWMIGPQAGSLPSSTSFCQVDAPNVHLLALKAAENGDGLILRLAETEGKDTSVTISLPYFEIHRAVQTNLMEESTPFNPVVLVYDTHQLTLKLTAHSLNTIRCS